VLALRKSCSGENPEDGLCIYLSEGAYHTFQDELKQ